MSIKFSKQASRRKHNRLQKLEKQLNSLLLETVINEAKITETEHEIKEIYDSKANGAQIRARIKFLEEGEKNTKYFLSLERSRQNRKSITTLTVNGQRISDIKDILNCEVEFYENLYKSKNTRTPEQYLNNVNLESKLTEQEANLCEGPITLEECIDAVNGMKLNKSPGLDGLTAEFYKQFWPYISSLVHESFLESQTNGELSRSQKQCVFSLLYKKGDPENMENWRPISLLNIDYKILARVLALRLQKVLPKIISLDQQGYIKNRYIGYNIRQIQDIIDYTETLDIDGVILFLDFKKAFDTVEWDFMINVLRKFGFKNDLISWVNTLYKNICSSVINNGWKSDFFEISRGIRQGCPLSALLFIIVAEILANRIRTNEEVSGIQVQIDNETHKLKITQLADDTTLFLKNATEIPTVIKIVEEFGNYSGLKLNKKKTEGIFIGKLKTQSTMKVHDI